nr:d-amino-acid oxidase [Quercus suber]
MAGGTVFGSVCINTSLYLPWLAGQCLKAGVVIKRGIVTHVTDAASLHHSGRRADLIVNCTGLSSLHLKGVENKTLYPLRGQVVVVRNDPGFMATVSGTDDGDDEACYIMNRAGGGGCVLGGCVQKDNWESQPDPNAAVRIMKRAIALVPGLVPEGKGIEALSIIRHGVGLRPVREGGIRVQLEDIDGVPVVHNYGHGGYGYQTSYAAARAAVKLIDDALRDAPHCVPGATTKTN